MTTPTDSQKMKSPMRTGEAVFVQIFICQLRRLWRLFLFAFSMTVQRACPESGEIVCAQRHVFVVPQGERGGAIFYIRGPRLR